MLEKAEILSGPLKTAGTAASKSISGVMNIVEMAFSGIASIADGTIDFITGFWLTPKLHGVEPQHEAQGLINMWIANNQTASDYYYIWTHGGIYSAFSQDQLVQRLTSTYGYEDWTNKQIVSNYSAYEWAVVQVGNLVSMVGL